MPRHGPRRWNPRLVVGGAVIALLALVAVLAPVLAPGDPLEMGPSLLAPPSREHLLGTDSFGRDVLTRLLYAADAGAARIWLPRYGLRALPLFAVLIFSYAAEFAGQVNGLWSFDNLVVTAAGLMTGVGLGLMFHPLLQGD